jgi:CRISPR-associated endonuclease Cas1
MTLLEPAFAHAEIDWEPQIPSPPAKLPDEWAERGNFWIAAVAEQAPKRRKRERSSAPLILCGHGVSLRVEQGTLVIRDGFTHYPQEQAAHRFFPGSRDIPTRILLLDGSGTLSFDVLSWLGEQGVALARVKWTGEVAAVASGTGFAKDPEKLRWQHETRADEAKRIEFSSDLIRRKLLRAIETLRDSLPESRARTVAMDKLRVTCERLSRERFAAINDIRILEGECAARYFDAWQGLQMEWTGTARSPVPDEWRGFTSRSSLANGTKPQNRCASHPLNAMLNYAYAVTLAQLQLEAIAGGYDPTIGIMHQARRGKPSFALDMIEPQRPAVDEALLQFIRARSFKRADFVIRPDGACRLSPQLARAVAALVS